mgnify:CR=1 FL=1
MPKNIPYQPKFRHLTTLLQINNFNADRIVSHLKKELKNEYDEKRLRARTECAKNWLQKHAPEEFRFTVQEKYPIKLKKEEKEILHELADKLLEQDWTDVDLHEEMYLLCKRRHFQPKDFFTLTYKVLINKERGPRLAAFILEIGRKKVAGLLKNAAGAA